MEMPYLVNNPLFVGCLRVGISQANQGFYITGATGVEVKIKIDATASPDFLTIGTSKTIKQQQMKKDKFGFKSGSIILWNKKISISWIILSVLVVYFLYIGVVSVVIIYITRLIGPNEL
ncbi:MAG: hypothetical protein BGO34_15170 [Bacteroidia bacterium 44-10]|nr:MAG: hypothetical protein BGO34_15170 [Bacteroidia bacterium 44-10]